MAQWTWSGLGNRPIFFPVLMVLCGAALLARTDVSGWAFLAAGAVLLLIAIWRGARWGGWLAVLGAGLAAGGGIARLHAAGDAQAWPVPGARVVLEGEVERATETDDGQHLVLDVSRVDGRSARARVGLSAVDAPPLSAGQRVLVPARLRPPMPRANPGEWSRFEAQRRRGELWTGRADGERLVLLSGPSAAATWLARAHFELAESVRAVAPDEDAAALLLTLAAGLRADLGDRVEEDFARSGLAHVLSVSGLHVAVLAFALFGLVRRLLVRWPGRFFRRVDPRVIAAPAAMPLVWAYVAYTGWQAPAVRSAVMCTLVLLGHALRRRSDPLNALSAAALFMVLADPAGLVDLSVQLSFVAVLSLVLLAPLFRDALPVEKPSHKVLSGWKLVLAQWREAALVTFTASAAVTCASAPLVLMAFHRVGLAGLLSNVVCMPLSAALTLLAAGGAALHLVSPVAALPVLWAGAWLSHGLAWAAHAFAALPFAAMTLPPPPLSLALAWWAGLLALVLLHGRARLLAVSAPLAAGLFVALLPRPEAGVLEVSFLSVGHGDAIVLSSEGHHALLDGGGVPQGHDTGRRFVLPFLETRRIERLELVGLSHPHPDHALGLPSVLERVPAERVWLPAGAGRGPLVGDIVAAARGATVEDVELGHAPFHLGAATIEVLGPPVDRILLEGENDRSLVLRVRHGDVTFLFPGDVEEAGEESLALAEPVTVLKAPHHGSRTSSHDGFVATARPRFVVFCVGAFNRFGFPHGEVVERYEAMGARCLRTDLDGAVTFHSDGHAVSVETFRERGEVEGMLRARKRPVARPATAGAP